MVITFVVPSHTESVGGVTALYEFANGLARRGHEIHLVHVPWMTFRINSLDDLSEFRFEPQIEHHLSEQTVPLRLPRADVIFGDAGNRRTSRAGLPAVFVQGFGILSEDHDRELYTKPMPKICVARWLVDVGTDFGVPPEQLVHVPYGLDFAKYHDITPCDQRRLRVGMQYSVSPVKGASDGIAALELVKERLPSLEAVAFGRVPPKRKLPDWIDFRLSPSQREIVQGIYNESRVFMCSSTREGFGFTSIEAMACGCALATTDNGGSSDYAMHGDTALVSKPRDTQGLADNIHTLLSDDQTRTAVADRGADFVRRTFNWDESARRLERFLERYIARPADFSGTTHRDM